MNNKTTRHMFKNIVWLILLLLIPQLCRANPISFPAWSPERSNFTLALTINSITDLIVAIAALAVMGEWSDTDKFNFSCFMILMIIGGFIIDFVSIGISNVLVFAISLPFGAIFFLTSFIMLLFCNYLLSDKFLELPPFKRFLLGTAIAIGTNPAYYYFFTEHQSGF